MELRLNLVETLKHLGIQYVSPCKLEINGQEHQLQLLIQGFGAKNGMVVDLSWEKIKPISSWLASHEYGFSCFNPDEQSSLSDIQKLLEDWGKQ